MSSGCTLVCHWGGWGGGGEDENRPVNLPIRWVIVSLMLMRFMLQMMKNEEALADSTKVWYWLLRT